MEKIYLNDSKRDHSKIEKKKILDFQIKSFKFEIQPLRRVDFCFRKERNKMIKKLSFHYIYINRYYVGIMVENKMKRFS